MTKNRNDNPIPPARLAEEQLDKVQGGMELTSSYSKSQMIQDRPGDWGGIVFREDSDY